LKKPNKKLHATFDSGTEGVRLTAAMPSVVKYLRTRVAAPVGSVFLPAVQSRITAAHHSVSRKSQKNQKKRPASRANHAILWSGAARGARPQILGAWHPGPSASDSARPAFTCGITQ
jgi:hypothetical protein